jgi:FMN phosphatase YigB (HAD superfamily)
MQTSVKLSNPAYSGIKNIVFDYGGVIIDLYMDRIYKAFADLGVDNLPDLMGKLKDTHVFYQFEVGALGAEAFINRLLNLLPPHLNYEGETVYKVIAAWNAMLGEIPKERLELLTALKSSYNTFLLSNTNALHISAVDQYLKTAHGVDSIAPYFHNVYYSYKVGLRKPNADIYEHLLKQENLNPAETLFIDDNLPNIEAANALGIVTYHLQSPKEDVRGLFS